MRASSRFLALVLLLACAALPARAQRTYTVHLSVGPAALAGAPSSEMTGYLGQSLGTVGNGPARPFTPSDAGDLYRAQWAARLGVGTRLRDGLTLRLDGHYGRFAGPDASGRRALFIDGSRGSSAAVLGPLDTPCGAGGDTASCIEGPFMAQVDGHTGTGDVTLLGLATTLAYDVPFLRLGRVQPFVLAALGGYRRRHAALAVEGLWAERDYSTLFSNTMAQEEATAWGGQAGLGAGLAVAVLPGARLQAEMRYTRFLDADVGFGLLTPEVGVAVDLR